MPYDVNSMDMVQQIVRIIKILLQLRKGKKPCNCKPSSGNYSQTIEKQMVLAGNALADGISFQLSMRFCGLVADRYEQTHRFSYKKNKNRQFDDGLKDKADVLFAELGLNMTTAVNIFIRQVIRQGGIPFDVNINTDPFYSASNMKVLRQSIADADAGKLTEHELIEV